MPDGPKSDTEPKLRTKRERELERKLGAAERARDVAIRARDTAAERASLEAKNARKAEAAARLWQDRANAAENDLDRVRAQSQETISALQIVIKAIQAHSRRATRLAGDPAEDNTPEA